MQYQKQTLADFQARLEEARKAGKRPFGGSRDGDIHIYNLDCIRGFREGEARKLGIALTYVATLHASGVGKIGERFFQEVPSISASLQIINYR